jgi:phosphatidylglycerol:prolipoprotein diacylglycerol transferase
MKHTLLHLFGPFSIHGYGLMIAIGLLAFIYLVQRDPRFKELKLENSFSSILMLGIVMALIGGRALFFITHPEMISSPSDFLAFYEGGFSILGSILAVLFTLPAYLRYLQIPIIPFIDLITLYTPLLQSISRIGCFFAGCCYGLPSDLPWAVTYTDTESAAPLYTCLHPTQIYSSIGLMLIFALLYFVIQKIFKKPGQIACFYFLGIGIERFTVEFWRGDVVPNGIFSLNQQVAATIIVGAIIGLTITSFAKRT